MDFSQTLDYPKAAALLRPQLNTEKHQIYEDVPRSTQVLSEMHRFYQDERWCDIILRVDATKFHCHRLVLAASSIYFERMFSNDMTEKNAAEIRLREITPCALKRLIEFAYTSKLSVCKDTALEIFEGADMLQFTSAKMFCQDFLMDQIDQENCLAFMLYADAFSCEPMYEKAKLTAATFFGHVCQLADFVQLPHEHLHVLLQEDCIGMEYEEHVYEALKRWILHDRMSRKEHLPKLFGCIRLNFVSRWYLIEVISKDTIIVTSEECNNIVQSAKDQLLAQGHTYEIPWHMPPSRKCTGLTQKIVYVNTYDPNPREADIYLFDMVNKSWSNTSKPCPLASEFSTCESTEKALLIIGGWNTDVGTKSLNQRGATNAIHEFKVMSIFPTLWYVGAHPMGIARYLHSTLVVGEQLYLLGGYDESQSLQASVFVTTPRKNYRFEVCHRMLYPVCSPAVAAWQNQILAFGGFGEGGIPRQFIQCYDIARQKWFEIRPGIEGAYISYQYAVEIENLIYVLCGTVETIHGPEHPMVGHRVAEKCLDSIHTFNPITCQWKRIFQFPERRTGNFCVTTMDKKIYITGGQRKGQPYTTVDCFDPATGSLETAGSIREGKGALSLCTTMTVMHENFGL